MHEPRVATRVLQIGAARSHALSVVYPAQPRSTCGLSPKRSGSLSFAVPFPSAPPILSAYVASANFFRRYPVPGEPEQLRHLPCIRLRFESGRYYHWEFERDGIRKTIEVPGRLTINARSWLSPPLWQDRAARLLFESQVAQRLKEGKLIRDLEEWCPAYPGHFLYYPGHRQPTATLRAFVDFIKSETP